MKYAVRTRHGLKKDAYGHVRVFRTKKGARRVANIYDYQKSCVIKY